jgi:AcrR family transcriptional regulator
MSARKVLTDIRQDQIAQAALDVIGLDGLHGMSISSIARKVGLVPSAIYRHFESKDSILDAVLDLIEARLVGIVDIVRAETPDSLEQLHRLLLRHIQLVRDNHGIPRAIFSDELYVGHPERRARIYAILDAYVKKVAALIHQGRAAGYLQDDGDPEVLAVMFLGLIQPAARMWHLSGGTFDITRQAEQAWQIFSRCLQTNGRYTHERSACSPDA